MWSPRDPYRQAGARKELHEDCEFVGGIDISRQSWPADPDYIVVADLERALKRVEQAIDALDSSAQQAAARRHFKPAAAGG